METIELKNRYTGETIYTHTCEGNSIKITVERAVKEGISLHRVNLYRADLSGADLYGADMFGANLIGANFFHTILTEACLSDANLHCAKLTGAKLVRTILTGAKMAGVSLAWEELKDAIGVPMYCQAPYGITGNYIHIGSDKRTIEEWDAFFAGNEVISTRRGTPEFKQIQAVYEGLKAYKLFLDNN